MRRCGVSRSASLEPVYVSFWIAVALSPWFSASSGVRRAWAKVLGWGLAMSPDRRKSRIRLLVCCLTTILLCSSVTKPTRAQSGALSPPGPRDLSIPLADGNASFALLWTPTEDTWEDVVSATGPWPIVLLRTPYGVDPDGRGAPRGGLPLEEAGVSDPRLRDAWLARGWAVVEQHVRGTGRSPGTYGYLFQERADGAATVEWLTRQEFSDGRVAMVGASYEGTVQWLAADAAPQGLRCITPTASFGALPFDQTPYVGGAFHLSWAVEWLPRLAGARPATRRQVLSALSDRPLLHADRHLGGPFVWWRLLLSHPTLDSFWQPLVEVTRGAPRFEGRVLTITGWFDGDLAGSLELWRRRRAAGFDARHNRLLIGPWNHQETWSGGDRRQGVLRFPSAGEVDVQAERDGFLAACLDDREHDSPPVRVYLSGRDVWLSGRDYPPVSVEDSTWWLSAESPANTGSGGGRLIRETRWEGAATSGGAAGGSTERFSRRGIARELDRNRQVGKVFDRYTYDPREPVPSSVAGEVRWQQQSRDDVLVYTSAPLSEELAVLGPVRFVAFFASDAPDTDLVARLVDVLPDGRPVGLRHTGGVLRLRSRHGFERIEALEPAEPVRVTVELGDFAHVFGVGHRLRLEVTSSDAPYIDPHPNTMLRNLALERRFRVARQTLWHGGERRSHLVLSTIVESSTD